jgi:hypothetical protein
VASYLLVGPGISSLSGTGVDRPRSLLGFPLLLVLADVLSTRQSIPGKVARNLG